jgi:hypothetical protein
MRESAEGARIKRNKRGMEEKEQGLREIRGEWRDVPEDSALSSSGALE